MMPPPPTQTPTPTFTVDPKAKPQIEEIYRLLSGWSKVLTEMGSKTDRLTKSFGGMHETAAMTRKEFDEFLSRSKADQALAVGAKMKENARRLAVEHMTVAKELREVEASMRRIQQQHFAGGGTTEGWVKKWTTDAKEFDPVAVKVGERIDELQKKMSRLSTAIPDRNGLGAALGERLLGGKVWSRVAQRLEAPRAAGFASTAGALWGGGKAAIAAEAPALLAAGAAASLKYMWDAGRASIVLNRQFDAMVDRSGEIGKAMLDVTGTLGLGSQEAAAFLSDLRQSGIHATELAVVSKDMLLTQRALNVSTETQVRLFKMVSREIYGGQVGMVDAEERTKNMVRMAAILGQQLRQFTVDEMLEGTEQMARHIKGITADVESLPAKFVMISTAAGLATLGLAKASGLTDDMAKNIGKMVNGLQDAPLDQQLFGAMSAFPNRPLPEQLGVIGNLRAGRLKGERGTAGLSDMLAMTFAPQENVLRQLLASDPSMKAGIARGEKTAIAGGGVLATEVLRQIPGMQEFGEQNKAGMQIMAEEMMKTIASGGSLIDEKGGGSKIKEMADNLLKQGALDQKGYDQLLNLGDIKSTDKNIEKAARTIAEAQNPIKTLLGIMAARSLGVSVQKAMQVVTGTDVSTGEIEEAIGAGVTDLNQVGKYKKYKEYADRLADQEVQDQYGPTRDPRTIHLINNDKRNNFQRLMGLIMTNGSVDPAKLDAEYQKMNPGATPSVSATPSSLDEPANQTALSDFIYKAEASRGKTMPRSTTSAYAAQMIEASRLVKILTGYNVSPFAIAGTAAIESDYRLSTDPKNKRVEPDGDYSLGMTQIMKRRTWDRWRADPKVPLEQMGIGRNLSIEDVMADPANAFKLGAYHMAETMKYGKEPIGSFVGTKNGADDVRRAEFDALLRRAMPGAIRAWSADGLSIDIVVNKAPTPAQNIQRAGSISIPGAPLPALSGHSR